MQRQFSLAQCLGSQMWDRSSWSAWSSGQGCVCLMLMLLLLLLLLLQRELMQPDQFLDRQM